jgi:outer membrane protein OmpA-like peptidoglycan-associated protein
MRFTLFILTALLNISSYSQEKTSNCLNHVNGIVVSQKNADKISKAIIHVKLDGQLVDEGFSDEYGHFSFDLECDKRYQISAIYENHTKNIKLVFTSKTTTTHDIKLELFPIEEFKKVGEETRIIANSIEFMPDDFGITAEAAKQLNIVHDLMEKYQHIKVEIKFHTDSRGKDSFLLSLSQKRADVCANYLIKRGIDASRLSPKGYGATQLLNSCKKDIKCSNAEHIKNRRTEFVVMTEHI